MTILLRDDSDNIARLTLNSPQNLNALSDAMLAALHEALDAIADDSTIRAVIITGAGKAFCAGHDLREIQATRQSPDQGAAHHADLFARCAALMARIRSLPQPVIAQVHGIAAAAGCQLVATCDMAVADDATRFGVNGVNIGLFCATPMVALTRAVPSKAAFEMLTTGRLIEADEALTLGLVNKVVPGADLRDATDTLAQTIAAKLAVAVRYGKQSFYAQAELPEAEAYALTGRVMVENLAERETDEGLSAFLAKRKPNWPT